jgi:hypothetical protein
MTLNEGKRVKNILTGKVYKVKKMNKDWVLLQAEDGLSQVLTGKMGLKFMYAWEWVAEESLNIVPPFPELGQKAAEAGEVHIS